MARHLSDETILRIAELYRQGYGYRRIGKALGLADSTVQENLWGNTRAAKRLLGGRICHGRRPAQELAKDEIVIGNGA